MKSIYPDARPLCGEVLDFTTKAHKRHVCINGFPHINEKHSCQCGVTWTKDPDLAKPPGGQEWSSEQVIFDEKYPPAYQGGRVERLDPTKNYNSDDDKKENYN